MKIAAPYVEDSRWRNLIDEYNLNYSEKTKEGTLPFFCETYPTNRVNVFFKDVPINIIELKKAMEFNPEVYVRLSKGQLHYIEELKEQNIKFFLDDTFPCISLDLLQYAIKIGSSDIYLYGDLWYQMDSISELCKKNNIHIRLILNEIPSLSPLAWNDYTAPIFTPRDKEILEKYIDTIEFNCFVYDKEKYYNWHRFEAYYKTWIEKGNWIGDLQELMPNLQFSVPVYSLKFNFSERRMNCKHRCLSGSSCQHCQQLIELAQDLNAQDIYIKE